MTSIAAVPTRTAHLPSRAPLRHLVLLVGLLLALGALGALRSRGPGASVAPRRGPGDVAILCLSLIGAEWGLVYWVWKGGLRRTGATLRELMGGRWRSWRDVATDAGFALGLWASWRALLAAWQGLAAPAGPSSVDALLPRGVVEASLWVVLSLSAGYCEELVFRGYLLARFETLTRSRWAALLAQAVLFGVSHGYQGARACLKIAVYGLLFGLMALWRRSLRPGMMAHAWTDITAGLLG